MPSLSEIPSSIQMERRRDNVHSIAERKSLQFTSTLAPGFSARVAQAVGKDPDTLFSWPATLDRELVLETFRIIENEVEVNYYVCNNGAGVDEIEADTVDQVAEQCFHLLGVFVSDDPEFSIIWQANRAGDQCYASINSWSEGQINITTGLARTAIEQLLTPDLDPSNVRHITEDFQGAIRSGYDLLRLGEMFWDN